MMQDPGDLTTTVLSEKEQSKFPPTRSRVSSEQLLSPKKAKKKKKPSIDSMTSISSPLDQLVADNVDPVLLDCLEDELPTVPSPPIEDPLEMLNTYSTCTSMSVCNSRWLRPNKRDSMVSSKKENIETKSTKKLPSPNKPKRIIIYKDDLPGFNIDSDMEAEKLPVSKRGKAKARNAALKDEEVIADNKESQGKREAKKSAKCTKLVGDKKSGDVSEHEDLDETDEDSESVKSFTSTASSGSRKRRRTNKTGFPSPKKKKKSDSSQNETNTKSSPESVKCKVDTKVTEKSPGPQKDNSVKDQKLNKVTPKKTVSKQLKMDRFITNDKSSKTKTATGKKNIQFP